MPAKKKTFDIEEPEQDPTTAEMVEQSATAPKYKKADLKKYLFLVPPNTYADLNALVATRNLDRIRKGGKAYTLNQLLISVVGEYLDRDDIKSELAKAREILGDE